MAHRQVNVSSGHSQRVATRKQVPQQGIKTLREYLSFVSITGRELSRLASNLRRLELLVMKGRTSQAVRYGNLLARSYLLAKASTHSVLRDATSSGLGINYRAEPWRLNIRSIKDLIKASPRMRVWLDKPDGGLRPLAVPELRDRIRERSLLTVMEILAARKQDRNSIGFRYNQDVSRGLSLMLGRAVIKYGTDGFNLLDTDFRKYYDSIPHSGLRTVLRRIGMRGRNWNYLCSSLTAPIRSSKGMVERAQGKIEGPMAKAVYVPTQGTPQGCVVSPLLANLYGTCLDKRLGCLDLPFIRYADNLLVAYPTNCSKEEIIRILEDAKPAGITLHEGKTQTLEGSGTMITLGCAIQRSMGKLQLLVCGGYLGTKRTRVAKVTEPYGGIRYVGQVLDFLRNLKIHTLHQNYADRRAWTRIVGNNPTYRQSAEGDPLRGGLWRVIKIVPSVTGTMRSQETPLLTVRSWKLGEGIVATDLMEKVRKSRKAILEMRTKLREILDKALDKIPGSLLRLRPSYSVSSGFLLDPMGYKGKPKYNSKETKFSRELKAKVILSQKKEEYGWNEMRQIGRGLGVLSGKELARLRRVVK